MRVVRIENGSGGSSPGCISSADQSIVRPSSRGGVPVFKRPSSKAEIFQRARKSHCRRFADAAGGNLLFADMNQAAQKRAGRKHHGTGRNFAAISEFDAANATALDHEIIGLGFDHLEVWDGANRGLHRCRIKLAIGLGARAAHGWAFAAVQDPKLDAAQVGDSAHKAIQGVDFPDQMAFSEPANRRIAGHGANGRELMGNQGRLGTHTGSRSRGFTAGMAAANHHDVESVEH